MFNQLPLTVHASPWRPNINYLGVIIDNGLSWRNHIDHDTKKAKLGIKNYYSRLSAGKVASSNPTNFNFISPLFYQIRPTQLWRGHIVSLPLFSHSKL
jgi:hypothetical protein